MGAVEVVERNLETGEIRFVLGFYPRNLLFRADTFFLGAQHDGGAVGVVGANIVAFVATQFLEPNPDISLNVFQQVAEVNGTIGIGQGAGDEDFAGILCGHDNSLRVIQRKGSIVAIFAAGRDGRGTA